jgi:hypothetical protein
MMADDTNMGDWKVDEMMTGGDGPNFGGFSGANGRTGDTMDPAAMNMNFDFSDKSMENDFDFESASSSPSPFGNGVTNMNSPDMPAIRFDTPIKNSPRPKANIRHHHMKANSQHSMTQSMHGLTTSASREASPLSAMVTSQESSPAAFFNASPSPGAGVEFVNGQMLNGAHQNMQWPPMFDPTAFNNGLVNHPSGPALMNTRPPFMGAHFKPILTIHPTPLKSRVETQIPIKMTLFPMPAGVTKLHLPTHTISKPKLLSKPPPERSPDTLELHTTLVCTSAMQNPEFRRRAFARAAQGVVVKEERRKSIEEQKAGSPIVDDEDDENKPLNGGEVSICPGCVTRERKRAARKKVKKAEEEEAWHKDENKRVIVFNTHEVKDWQVPSGQTPSDAVGDRREPMVPEGAMQVDAPMRIACYCRHQNEKLGFQVIFTIKDHMDRLVAQEITSSIMITDDHKTHAMPPLSTQTSDGSIPQGFPSNGNGFSAEPAPESSTGPVNNMAAFRMSHSSSDLQGLQRNFPVQPIQFTPPINPPPTSSQSSQNSSTTVTRGVSRQNSPSASTGPTAKKRKASGSSKVPSGLAMTRLETSQAPSNSSTASTKVPSPFTPSMNSFPTSAEHSFMPPIPISMSQQFNTGPPTPNSNDHVTFSTANRSQSMENLALHHPMYSAPTSSHPSRAPSPNGLRNSVQAYQQQQAQIAQAVANGLYGMPLSLNPHRPPTIHKLIPSEGPKAGGIEVTCLGSGFCQGLEVMFGDSKATTTTFWGETSLVCLLPPAVSAGLVPVTFKHQHQPQMQPFPTPPIAKQQALFKYVDDDEQQIIRTALLVLGHKMTGKMEDVQELARRIVGDGSNNWSVPSGQSPSGTTQHSQVSGFSAATFGVDVEATLLRCLDLIDLDDSPHMPRLNLRRPSGQTMLHLACSLGLHRFAAALLARGANPEPRDKSGYTPMHFAALHNHPQIVRRLMLSGADPTMRSLQGYTPADLSASDEVLRATRRVEHHTRTRSGGSLRSRTNSATSLRSVWEPLSVTQSRDGVAFVDDFEAVDDSEDDSSIDESEADEDTFYMRSRRRSSVPKAAIGPPPTSPTANLGAPSIENVGGLASPSAAMTAFRDQLSAQIQHLQQTMHLNLPNLPQMPSLSMMPNLPDYQAYLPAAPMVRRFGSLVPNRASSRPGSAEGSSKEPDHKWWDLFSGSASPEPPAYDDIFPHGDLDRKRSSATQAAADAVADQKCATIFDTTTAESSSAGSRSVLLEPVRIGKKHSISKEQQDQLRLAHAEKVKRIRSDRNLFFIWVSIIP